MTCPVRDERGQSVSLFVLLVMGALVLVAGLVVDGGQKVAAAGRAEAAAAGASRAAGNAAATRQLGGAEPAGAAVLAAKAYLAGDPTVQGTVSLRQGVVRVETRSSAPTIFLSVVGLATVTGTGSAEAVVVPTGGVR
ncbi:hypothetical protein SAMN04488543_4253 [Friedmanniella luteola]|uniref:Flp pilus-assembly TadE/G-like n=1 Tax=Friedmanniella luteola TaxID=546871 RepID=A0A1H2A704_9ACTN|nr:hypothetical protein [Friedmanniella luteola]SDT41562.1 hypothetical protein SAMN04488543_4253 [Friedmanniella luteola]